MKNVAAGFEIKLSGKPIASEVAADVESVVFTDGLDLLDELKISIKNPGRKYTREKDLLIGLSVELWGGWIGIDWGWYFTGKIEKQNPSWQSGSTPHIELLAFPVNTKTDGWHVQRLAYYTGAQRISDVVRDVIQRYHPEFKTVDDDGNETIEDTQAISDLAVVIQQDETDIEFLKKMAEYAGGYEFNIKNNCVIFRKSKPTASTVMTLDPDVNVIGYSLGETSEGDADNYTQTSEQVGNSTDTEDQEFQVVEARQSDETKAEYEGEAVDYLTPCDVNTFSFLQSKEIATNINKAAAKKAATSRVTLTAEVIDLNARLLRAGRTVIWRSGEWFDGKFYINPQAVHTFDSTGYKVSVELSNFQPGS